MKQVVISGGSSGIGLATAERFSREGYHVYILDIHSPQITVKNSCYLYCDVTKISEIENALAVVKRDSQQLDALVCCAGIHFSADVLNTSEIDYTHVMDINFKGSFFLTQAALPLMLEKQKGAIIFVGSDQTLIAKHNSAIYGASKAALGSLTKTTALDFAKQGIRANLVAVGTIDTPLYQAAIQAYCAKTNEDLAAVHHAENLAQPIGRIGQPEEVANLIYFLASDEASFITGGIYAVDGGYTAQ